MYLLFLSHCHKHRKQSVDLYKMISLVMFLKCGDVTRTIAKGINLLCNCLFNVSEYFPKNLSLFLFNVVEVRVYYTYNYWHLLFLRYAQFLCISTDIHEIFHYKIEVQNDYLYFLLGIVNI